MLICLSSGSSPRYRKDVFRSLAMPEGSSLQFRYDLHLVSQEVKSLLSNNMLKNVQCLIAYIDQYDKTKTPEIIPCRFAKVKETKLHGTTTSLILELEDFAFVENLKGFNDNLRAIYNELPLWQRDETIRGFYCFQIQNTDLNISKYTELATWQEVVNEISKHHDFLQETVFYQFQGLFALSSDKSINLKNGKYKLKPGCEYEARVYHYHPKITPQNAGLILNVTSQLINFITSPLSVLDSRYDLKRFRLKTSRPSNSTDTILSILRSDNVTTDRSGSLEFDLLLQIKGTFWQTFGWGLIIGLLLATPQIIATLSNSSIKCPETISSIQGVSSLLLGELVAFGQKKLL